MKLDHCHRASCVQIIEALRAKVEELSNVYTTPPAGLAGEHILNLEAQVAALTQERDALSSVVRDDYVELKGLQVEAAAKDAVIERLKDVLDTYGVHDSEEECAVCTAVGTPNDDSALQERLVQERERCAKVCEEVEPTISSSATLECASAIRSMK